jgi:hypothetical protein
MKKAMVMILAAPVLMTVIGTNAWAKGLTAGPVVTVCMESNADSTVERAQMEAAAIFSEISVKISWRSGRACSAADVIHIHLSNQTPGSLKPGALAYARPYEGTYIEVFYDRVAKTVCAETLPHLLAHVLVHEITHILEGVSRHSETGVMKAHWTSEDYRNMVGRHLPFAPEDVELVRLGMNQRTERLQAAAVTPAVR